MSVCCGTLEDFGCYCFCDDTFDTIVAPTQDGVHTLYYNYQGNVMNIEFNALIAGVFELPNIFNEDGMQFFQIANPDGSYFELNGSDCFFLTVNGCSSL